MRKSIRRRGARYFGQSGWRTLKGDPFEGLLTDSEDWGAGLARRGWVEFSRTGPAWMRVDGSTPPLHLLVLHRPDAARGMPRFLIELSGNLAESCAYVFAEDADSLMALLAAWAPALESSALTHWAAGLPSRSDAMIGLLAG